MRVQDIMVQDASRGTLTTNAAEAAEIMWTKNCGSLPIVEDGGRVIGMVTDRDLFIALGTQNRLASEVLVGEIMHPAPSVCTPEDDVRHALRTMAKHRVQRLPVVDISGVLKGILSIDDVLLRTDSAYKEDTIRTLKVIGERLSRKGENRKLQAKPATA